MAKKTNFEVNGKQYYRVTRTIGHKPDGTPIKKQFYGTGINEANKKADEYIDKIQSGLLNDFDKITLIELMSKWLYEIKKYDDIKPSTFESYDVTFRRYIQTSEIANCKLYNMKTITLQDCYIKMSKNGFSGAKIKKMNKLLYQFFKYAINEGYLNRNPAENIVIPKLEKEKKLKEDKLEYYSEEEVKLLKKSLKGNELELLVLFALGTGLRQGELLALRYSDIDYDNMQIHVQRTVKTNYVFDANNKKHRQLNFLEPKTKNSNRIVDIPSSLFKLLPVKNTDELIFTDNGNVWEARKLYRHWNYFLRDNNLPVKKFHSLRHTYATLLLSKGVELITVSKLLGHSSLQITEIYSHVIPKLKTNAVNKLNDIF